MNKPAILEKVALAWNDAGISYAVAHGIERFPEGVGRDFDVIVEERDINRALDLAQEALETQGLLVIRPAELWGPRLIAIDRGDYDMLEVHLLSDLVWRNIVLVAAPSPSLQMGPFRIDPWLTFAKRIFLPLLACDHKRFLKKPEEFRITPEERRAATENLSKLFGQGSSKYLVEAVWRGEIEAARQIVSEFRKKVMLQHLRRKPIDSLRLIARSLIRRCRQLVTPCAPVVALVGPDGVGKSTALRVLTGSDSLIFLGFKIRHWRPNILPRIGSFVGKPLPQANDEGLLPPRRHPGRFYWLRLVYYFLDFYFGYYLRDRLDSSRQRIVFYDRHFLDMMVDPLRFGLSSTIGIGTLWKYLPKPDLIIFLKDSPDEIFSRKPELSKDEIARQLNKWQGLVERGDVHLTVEVDVPPAEIANRIMRQTIKAFIRINQGTDGIITR